MSKESNKKNRRVVTVVVEAYDTDKEGIEGRYQVAMALSADPKTYADVALDVFHSNFPVSVLADYSFTVEDCDGNLLAPADTEPYSLKHQGELK